ncbi:receptor-like protein 7 [Magnolia sinica]|uniref:receptor-like protein 7 n=1 Tax=Magnolia sinica TaxID=86752 RepID=UPI00265B4565|nr:receptor-like protein 7 [Magnolia sinica]
MHPRPLLSALLRLKHGFNFSDDSFTTLSSWNLDNKNCCSWEGIMCRGATGHVISLNLSHLWISGWVDFQSIFHLHSLKKLDLTGNYFDVSPFPSGFNQLLSLTDLSLSSSRFTGQIPREISRLTSLVSLHLTYDRYYEDSQLQILKLENPSIGALVQNLSSLRELSLDGVKISAHGTEWGQALFNALPRLRKFSLSYCKLSGPIHSSLSQLPFLSELDLSNNSLSSALPKFVTSFSKLHYLDLSSNSFSGPIPSSYGNELLNLEEIILSGNLLNGTIPSSLFSLPSLRRLDLRSNQLEGQLGELHNASFSQLEDIYLDNNNLQGIIPSSIFKLRKLGVLSCPSNNFSGNVELGLFMSLKNFWYLDLSDNSLSIDNPSNYSSSISFPPMIKFLKLRSCNISEFPGHVVERSKERKISSDALMAK